MKHPVPTSTLAREENIFNAAVQLAGPISRSVFLEQACGADMALRARIEKLLAVADDTFFNTPPAPSSDASIEPVSAGGKIATSNLPPETPGTVIGRYKLLQEIGAGGMGVVYMAEQEEPVRRRVALKIIKLGMDTKSVIARFEAERQALAMMDHPNIAKVLDGGATDAGRPYFVMELVRGIKITEYCDEAKLSTRDRLDLFIKVCQAIQHAHQKGIIHRDIKPSNILVTINDGVAVPKVIDFGIAKATEGRLTDKTLFTQFEAFIGTPAYVSPEQAVMTSLDIDTRSDIYSLGVLLYELLAGSTPFDAKELMASGIDAMRKTIREQEPMRPSNRLATLRGEELTTTAKRRSVDSAKLLSQLQGDLDWIVMKCLDKDRTRRYETANGLAADLKRHLTNEPVTARPPSTAYKVQKAFRRNKLAFIAAALILGALLAGLSVASVGFRHAVKQRNVALEARKAEHEQRQAAQRAQANEMVLRQQAERRELAARRHAYSSDLREVQTALKGYDLDRARFLLDRHKPAPGERDFRGWEWRYLWSQSRGEELRAITGLDSQFGNRPFSPDGRYLVYSERGKVRVLDLASRRALIERPNALLPTFTHRGLKVVFLSQGPETNAALTLLDLATSRETIIATNLPHSCTWIGLTPDDQIIFTLAGLSEESDQNFASKLSVWNAVTGKLLWERSDYGRPGISPDGHSIAAPVAPDRLLVFGVEDGREHLTIQMPDRNILAVVFSPDRQHIVTTTLSSPMIRVWDARTGVAAGVLEGHLRMIDDLVFTPDGKRLISCSRDHTIRVWDWAARKQITVLNNSLRMTAQSISLSPDARTLAALTARGAVFLQDLERRDEHPSYRVLPVPVAHAVFNPDSRALVTAEWDGGLAQWDLYTLGETRRWLPDRPSQAKIQSPAPTVLAPDGTKAVSLNASGGFSIRDLGTGQMTNAGQNRIFNDLRFTDNGRCLLALQSRAGDRDNSGAARETALEVQVFDAASWQLIGNMITDSTTTSERPIGAFTTCIPNSMVTDASGILTFWDVARGASPVRTLPVPQEFPPGDLWFSATVSPDQRWFAAGSGSGSAFLWDLEISGVARVLSGHTHFLRSLTFSPDGTRLATANMGGTPMKLWELEDGEELITLPGEGFAFRAAAFSPDGRFLMSQNRNGVLHLWSAPSWQEIDAVVKGSRENTSNHDETP